MLTLQIINQSFLEGIKGKWLKSISGINFIKYTGTTTESQPSYSFYTVYSNFEAYKILKPAFSYKEFIDYETVDSLELIEILNKKQEDADRWERMDKDLFMAENIPLFLDKKDQIYHDKHLFHAAVPEGGIFHWHFSSAVSIGQLLQEWEKGNLIQKCSFCGKPAYSIRYTPSGETSICPNCRTSFTTGKMNMPLWVTLGQSHNQSKKQIRPFRLDTVAQKLSS